MILREMPAIWDDSFRPWFYSRWGRENCIIGARTRAAEYPLYEQRLSVKAAWGGREDYFIDGRRLAVDDETYLVINDGRSYASRVSSSKPVTSFSIFFRPGMAADVARVLRSDAAALLEAPSAGRLAPPEISEHLRRHDRRITPVLRFILKHLQMGCVDEEWYEEQLQLLLERLLELPASDAHAVERIAALKTTTRRELWRRASLGADFIHSHFAERVTLADVARAAMLSPYHCLRVFKAAYGRTPHDFLSERRAQTAVRLLRCSTSSVDEIALQVGLQNRSTLFRQLKRRFGLAARALRGTDSPRAPSPVL